VPVLLVEVGSWLPIASVGQRSEIASALRLCVVLSFVNVPAITCSGRAREDGLGGKLAMLVVLVVGLGRLAAEGGLALISI
jgi:hypothetical protein